MPDEKVAPKRTPKEATSITTLSGAMREPTAEFKKFTASFETPTNKSMAAKMSRKTTNIKKMDSNIGKPEFALLDRYILIIINMYQLYILTDKSLKTVSKNAF
ncbi:hypothetical protein HMPREF9444_01921 [Succinatimonas hippei YIT 12066]|uniref:Uncharacterized protein n=1 Tax=Succinatimonas hippei (strain DSM 22608 / JCM 16073 / KCTC 15190 / YIT 12066) TaxID=762983 RepID=E8LMD4_SUCHY|nr:hypothetical protein HMPREF9444_01921 [Succinatimonas hippei YIT 12066]